MKRNTKSEATKAASRWVESHISDGKKELEASIYGTHDDMLDVYVIGIAGEIEFGRKFGLTPNLEPNPRGDGCRDFTVKVNGLELSIDIKTYKKPINLLVKHRDMARAADVFVLGKYTDFGESCAVEFLGWETKDVMRVMPRRIFSEGGCLNSYRHVSLLRPMWQLDKLLGSEFM